MLDLLSALRRRRDSDDHLCGLLSSRKMAKKMIQKSLRNISSFKNRPSVLALDKDQETIAIISMLKEAESITLDLIEALLFSIMGTKGHSRSSGWSLVSRLINPRKTSGQDHKDTLEFEELDASLCKLEAVLSSNASSYWLSRESQLPSQGGRYNQLQLPMHSKVF
ncbi:hypothetical protein Salat_1594800 [Sesamum alatum]|uniref:Uncharacterized protein n=1 Tax=Sesamum alatum TaxID=300844 RepID=A0AAE1Y5D9_9LAMI|nr:hypothetical protein Salat_1594800 [Sesamum alatum]